jgi:hypothetical protein
MTDQQKGAVPYQVLQEHGAPVGDIRDTVLMAQVMCFSLRQGQAPDSILDDIQSMSQGFTSSAAAFCYGTATRVFCPEFDEF